MKEMKNLFTKINDAFASSLTWNVLYAPDKSEQFSGIQNYKVIGHPRFHAWKTKDNNRVFTARVRNREKAFRTFRADRVLSVNLALW